MVMEENPEEQAATTAIVPEHLQEIIPLDSTGPVAPKGITDQETQELQSRAGELVGELEGASGSRELELIDSLGSVGRETQRKAGSELDLLRGRVGNMIANEGPGAGLTKDLVELRMALKQISPHELSQRGFMSRLVALIPIANKLTPALRVLERIAIRYESVSMQVAVIETKLHEGRMMLTKDNVEMRQLYEQVENQQMPIQKNAYLGELVMQKLTDLMESSDDNLKVERLRNALHDVSMRVQDLRTMEAVHTQFFVSIEMTRQNNTRLGQSVERTLTLATNVISIGLAIQTALVRQQDVLEAQQRTREFLGDVIASNAATIRQHTEAIGDVYNNPAIAFDKINQAHDDLIEAMDIADRLKQQGIDSARENIVRLSQLSSEMNERASGLRDQQTKEIQSIEA